MVLISFLLSAYVVSEYLGGSGALAVLVFGTVLGNDSEYLWVFRIHSDTLLYAGVYSYLNRLQSEISHILRTFFLVLLGLLLDPSPGNLVLGVSMGVPIIFMLLIIRYGVTFVSTWKSPMEADRLTITGMCALGLTPALLSFIPLQYGLQGASRYTLIVTNIIIMTNIITSVVTLLNKRSNGA